jgi:hypothetical protein
MKTHRNVLVALIAATMLVLSAMPASAAAPLHRDSWNDQFSMRDSGIEQGCGVDHVVAHHRHKGHAAIYEDGRVEVREQFEIVYENQANGAYVRQSFADALTIGPENTTLEGDLLTIEFSDTLRGNQMKWQAPGVGVILMDAGVINVSGTVIIDLTITDGDPVISFELNVLPKAGQFSWAVNGFWFTPEQGAAVCEALRG